MTDDYMDKLPVIPATSVKEIKERLKPFVEAGATRLIVPYVPVTEPVIDDARRFVEAWGNLSAFNKRIENLWKGALSNERENKLL